MKRKICVGCLLFMVCFSLYGCKSIDYNEAIEMEENKDYASAVAIYKELGEYKDAVAHMEYCNSMLAAIERYEEARASVEEKNIDLDAAISDAEDLIGEERKALDDTVGPALETAVSEAKAEKVLVSEMPETEEEILADVDEFNQVDYSEVLSNLSDKQSALERSIMQYEWSIMCF